MNCSKCGNEVDKLYHQGDTHLCSDCLMAFTHIHYKPNLCRVCGELIKSPLSLQNPSDGTRFCSIDCMASAAGFYFNSNKQSNDSTE